MSFGKNPQVLSMVGNFRQMSHDLSQTQYGKKREPGSGIPYFVDQFTLPKETTVIRLVAGEYLQDKVVGDNDTPPEKLEVVQVLSSFIKFTDHFDGQRQKSAICSGGPLKHIKSRREPCRGCDIFWATVSRNPQGRLESSRMSRQDKFALSIHDFSPYHKVEQYDQNTGQVKKNNQTGEPFFNWIRCFGMGCDMCRGQKEWKQGHDTHWNMSYTSFQTIRSAEVDIGKSCVVCGLENCIISRGWMCGHCGVEVIDMATTQLKLDELLKITDAPYGCGACGQKAFLKEVYQCGPCAQRGQQGVRATLFDVDLKVKGIPNSNGKGLGLQIAGWSAPYKLPEGAAKPIDLVARYKPTPMDVQISIFGEIPGQTAAPTTSPTGRQPVTSGQPYMNPYGPAGGGAPPPAQPSFQPPPQGGYQPPQPGQYQPPPAGGGFGQPAPAQPAPAVPANPYANPYTRS